jgi:hypothetical protein
MDRNKGCQEGQFKALPLCVASWDHTLHSTLKRLVLFQNFCQNYFLCKFLHRLNSIVNLLLHIGGTPKFILALDASMS